MKTDASQHALPLPLARLAKPARAARADGEPDARPAELEGLRGQPVGEEAFHGLLAVELARAGRSGRRLRLLRVSLKPVRGQGVEIKPVLAAQLFAGLAEALRETDVIGWHREGRVAGAVLVEGPSGAGADGATAILDRVRGALHLRLPSRVASQLHVRVVKVDVKPVNYGRR
jgi:hypothetical protein